MMPKGVVSELFDRSVIISPTFRDNLLAISIPTPTLLLSICPLIIIVAAFNIISVLTILIKNKSKEIAILRSIGFQKNSILKIFIFTGTLIGFFGISFGVILGILISYNLESIRLFLNKNLNINIFPPDIYFLTELPSHINYNSVLLIALLSIIIVLAASFFRQLAPLN